MRLLSSDGLFQHPPGPAAGHTPDEALRLHSDSIAAGAAPGCRPRPLSRRKPGYGAAVDRILYQFRHPLFFRAA